jgi:hypothetical protein
MEIMAIKITSIGSHAGTLRDEPGILSPVNFVKCGKGSSVNEFPRAG